MIQNNQVNIKIIPIGFAVLFFVVTVQAVAENLTGQNQKTTHESIFDPEKEIITIPNTHDDPEPYQWDVTRNPKNYKFTLNRNHDGRYRINLIRPDDLGIEEIHLFVTNKKIEFACHIIPDKIERDTYNFSFLSPQKGKYRFETVIKTEKGWLNFRKDIKLARETEELLPQTPGPEYEIVVKTIPAEVYTDHITTFIYEIRYKGKPVTDLQKTGGVDMHLFSWNSSWPLSLKEFNYFVSKQNFGGPEVPVSLVFKYPGRQVVFGEFSHMGKKRTVRYEVNAATEDRW